ncbi:hypothetical protein CYMTET_30418, partial [Cymbomonas tetramitiformis]
MVYAGGGDNWSHLVIAPSELLMVTRGELVDVLVPGDGLSAGKRDSTDSEGQRGRPEVLAAHGRRATSKPGERVMESQTDRPTEAYPFLQWVTQSSGDVQNLWAVVATTRKMGRQLMFADLVPLPSGSRTGGGNAGGWKMLEKVATAPFDRVQLLVGKTLARNRGAEEAKALIKAVKVGTVVNVTGRLQANPTREATIDLVCVSLDLIAHDEDIPDELLGPPPLIDCEGGLSAAAVIASGLDSAPFAGEAPCREMPSPELPQNVLLVVNADTLTEAARLLGLGRCSGPARPEEGGESSQSGSGAENGELLPVVLGIDAEWQPERQWEDLEPPPGLHPHAVGEDFNPVSVMQLATRSTAVVFDMLALCQQGRSGAAGMTPTERALDALMGRLLTDSDVLKLGFGLENDLRKLRDSYPHLPCFQGAQPVIEIRELLLRTRPIVPTSVKGAAGISAQLLPQEAVRWGLSQIMRRVLGRELDK